MNAKEYLKKIKLFDTIIQQKKESLKCLDEISDVNLPSADFSTERVSGGKQKSVVEILGTKSAEVAIKLKKEIRELQNEREIIIAKIQEMDNAIHISILYERYVNNKSFNLIAKEMHYSNSHIRRLHTEALFAFEKQYDLLKDDTK